MFVMPNATIMPFEGKYPEIAAGVFVADGARLIGNLKVGEKSSFWFNTTVRADVHHVTIGNRTNIQDGTVIHVTHDRAATVIGDDVTIGHSATIHGCTIENRCLIGMGAIILDRAVIGEDSVVAAGALVTQGKKFPPRQLIMGSPAVAVRELTKEEINGLLDSAAHYVELRGRYAADLKQ